MINIPYDKLVEKIVENSEITKEQIEEKVKTKLEQLAGLISKEGAVHIIANELGINLLQTQGILKTKDLLAGMRDIELAGKVIKKYEIREFSTEKRNGKVARFLIGDETGTTMIVMWNDQADKLENIQEEQIIKIKNANVRENNGKTEVHLGEGSELEINPQGIKIETKEYTTTNYPEPTRKKITELQENDQNVEILATIVQVFDPKYWDTDAETGKKIREGEPKPAKTSYGAVLNLFADDGTDNIRIVLWKNQILNLLKKTEEELKIYRETPEKFEEIKTELLGTMVKLIGKVEKNQMFERLELIAQRVMTDPDPEEELKKLEKQTEKTQNSEENPQNTNTQKTESTKSNTSNTDSDLDEELLDLEEIEDL